MRIGVVGAGSLGSVFAGVLADDGNPMVMITRNRAHVDAVNAHGLQLDDGTSIRTFDVDAHTSCDGVTEVDLVIVLVKSFDTRAAVEAAQSIIGPSTTVLSLQNGVGCEDIIAAVVGSERVIAGRTFVGGRIVRPGVVEYGVIGRHTTIGEMDGSATARVVEVADVFSSAGLDTTISTDIVAMMWDKLFVNVATGAWSALTRLPYGELSVHPDVEEMAVATVAEAMSVAAALGIAVASTDPRVPWRRAWEGLPYEFRASMLQSVDKRSRTEVDVMHGAVCDGGRRAGVPTPINDTLRAAVKGLEHHLSLE